MIEALGLSDGDVVADVACGMGYHTPWLAQAVGRRGLVYAVDVNPNVIEYLRRRLSNSRLNPHENVRCLQNQLDDVGLPDGSLDLAFVCRGGFFHYQSLISTNREMIQSIYRACKPGGRVAVIEKMPGWNGDPVGSLTGATVRLGSKRVVSSVSLSRGRTRTLLLEDLEQTLKANFTAAGFVYTERSDLYRDHNFIILTKPDPADGG